MPGFFYPLASSLHVAIRAFGVGAIGALKKRKPDRGQPWQ
jgi:hypothetical protein